MKLTNIPTCFALVAANLWSVVSACAAGVPGQGSWEITLLGRDINRNPVAAAAVSDWRLPGMLVASPTGPIRTMKLLTAIGLLFFFAAQGHAAIIYQHPPITTSGAAYQSAANIPNGSAYEERIWDRFQFATTQTIREIQWRGTYKDRPPVNFTVKIYLYPHQGGQSDYSHPPLASFQTNGNASEAPAGTFGGTRMYDYRFTLPTAFTSAGNVAYWLQIIATQDGLPDWKWAQGNGVGFADSTHYSRTGLVSNDSAYQTFGGDCCFALLDAATTPDATIVTARTPTAGGTVSGAGTYAQGTSVTVTASPAATYTFNGWKEGTTIVSPALGYTFTAAAYRNLTASFTAASGGPYEIVTRSFPTIGGSTKGTGTFNAGASVTVQASPGEGFAFSSWTENDQLVSTALDYTFTVSAHRNLVANFTTTDSAHSVLKLKSLPLGSGTFIGGGAYVGYSGTRLVRAVPASGYSFISWSNGSAVVSTNPAYTFNVVGNGTLYANFNPVPNIAASVGGGLFIAWPATASGWILQESPDLVPTTWVNSTLPITTSGGQKQVSIPNPTGTLFFRLARP